MFVLDLFNTKYEKELREGAVDKVVSEGGPYDLPGIDYDRPGDAPRRPRPSGGTTPRRHPDDPDFMDPDQRRLRAEQERLKKAWAEKNKGVAEATTDMPFGGISLNYTGDPSDKPQQYHYSTEPKQSDKEKRQQRLLDVRSRKQDLLSDYAQLGALRVEMIYGINNDVFLNKEQLLDYFDHLVDDPYLTPLEYAHENGIPIDGLLKGMLRRAAQLGIGALDVRKLWNSAKDKVKAKPGVAESAGQDRKAWMASIRQQHPTVKFVQAKMPGAPIMAMVNGKPVAQWDGKTGVAEGDNNSTHGMDRYVKPVRPGEINKALQKGIDQRKAARERMQANIANLPTHTKKGVVEETDPFGGYPQSPRAFGVGNFQRIVKANMGNLPTVTLEFADPNDNIVLDRKGVDLISDYYDGLKTDAIKNHFIYRVLPSADEVLTVLKKLGWNQAVQPELPGIPRQGELPLQEKKKFDPNSDVAAGDVKVARELQKLRAQYPAAKSDVEAVAKAEIDSSERSQQQLSAIKGANTEQDRLLQQLVDLDRKQGKEIGSLDNENDRLEQQLAHVDQTNARLAQAIGQMSGRAQSSSTGASQSRVIDMLPNSPADTSIQPTTAPEPSEPQEPRQKSKSDAMSRMAQSLGNQTRRVQGIDQGPAPSIRGNVTDLDQYRNDAVRRAQAAIADRDFKPLANQLLNKGVVSRTGTDDRLNEFAPGQGGGSGNYFQALASAWYNGTFNTGSLQKGIKSQQDVERLLNRGIVCPDGKTRKLHIDYNSDFDGVEIYSDDYYEHGDLDGNDGRTGQPWGPYDFMAFSDEQLDEGAPIATTPGSIDPGGAVDNFRQQMANNTELAYQKGMAEARKKKKKKSSRSLGRYFFPGYGYYGSGESGEGGGDGGGGEGESVDRAVAKGNINELSTDKLAQYKTAAALDAGAADKRGDYERGDKRFAGIVKATKKQFANDLKKHGQQGMAEGSSTSSDAVERAILNRIMTQHTDLLMRFGPDKVMQAAEEVAYNVGDVDEIGTSDVSAYINQVRQILGA